MWRILIGHIDFLGLNRFIGSKGLFGLRGIAFSYIKRCYDQCRRVVCLSSFSIDVILVCCNCMEYLIFGGIIHLFTQTSYYLLSSDKSSPRESRSVTYIYIYIKYVLENAEYKVC
jgi:hypothetical protein